MDGYVFNRGLSARHFSHPEQRTKQQSNAKRRGEDEREKGASSSVLAAGDAAAAASSARQFIPQSCVQTTRLSFKIMIRTRSPTGKATSQRNDREKGRQGGMQRSKMMENVTAMESED